MFCRRGTASAGARAPGRATSRRPSRPDRSYMCRARCMSATYLPRYLARLGFGDRPRTTLVDLAELQRRHVLAFPFENLCLHLPELRAPIVLDPDALLVKIVDGAPGRGGYCFELNILFARLLVDLGFRVSTGGARVIAREQPHGDDPDHLALQPLTHMILFVDVDGDRHLVDVGFGPRGPMAPIPLRHLAEKASGRCRRRCRARRRRPNGWPPVRWRSPARRRFGSAGSETERSACRRAHRRPSS